jgi:hypothetical protein
MLILDSDQIQYCQVKSSIEPKSKTISGLIYLNNIFIKVKSYKKDELDLAIKECREEYLDCEERTEIPTLIIKDDKGVALWIQDNHYLVEDEVAPSVEPDVDSDSNSNLNRISVRNVALQMHEKDGVEIKTRRHKLKLYHHSFLGNEAVDWLVKKLNISRLDAVKLGEKLIAKKIIHHVLDEYNFKDEPLFYRFYEDENKSVWTDKL